MTRRIPVSEEVYAGIEVICAATGKTQDEVIREVLAEYLKTDERKLRESLNRMEREA